MLRDEFEDEWERVRNAPTADISPETERAAYLDEDEEPSMADAHERAKESGGKDNFGVVASVGGNSPTGPEYGPEYNAEALRPKDFGPEYNKAALEPDESSAGLKASPPGLPKPPPMPAAEDGEYLSALRKIKESLAKPGVDHSKGYAEALQRDADENRTNRIMAFLSAGLRRAPTPTFGPEATHAANFLKQQGIAEHSEDRRLGHMEKLAELARPRVANNKNGESGNVEGLRAYLMKVGAGTPEELAGMNEKQLGAVMDVYKLDQTRTGAAQKDAAAAAEVEALRREAAKQLPGMDLSGLGATDLRGLLHAKDAKERARIIAAAAAKKAEEGRPLAPSALSELADADVAKKQVEGLAKTFNELGMGTPSAKVSTFFTNLLGLQFTDAAEFEAEAGRVRQAAGKILEGGKLAAGDDIKYKRLMLQPGDSPEVVASKTAGMVAFLDDIKAGRIKVYREGGYRVPDSGGSPPAHGGAVRMRFPDGSTHKVEQEEVELAKQKGGVLVR